MIHLINIRKKLYCNIMSSNNEKKYLTPNERKNKPKKGFGNKWKTIPTKINKRNNFRDYDENNNKYSEKKKVSFNNYNSKKKSYGNKNFMHRRRENRKNEFIQKEYSPKNVKNKVNDNQKITNNKDYPKQEEVFDKPKNSNMIFSTSSFRPYNKKKDNFSKDHFIIPKKQKQEEPDTKPISESERNFILNYANNLAEQEEESENEELAKFQTIN